jgi:peptidoglycan/LPS O-acetylase OafA/YrhL
VQIDVMRLLICASVVATHVVSNTNPMESVPPNAVVNALHYTRQAFFFISALVLVYTSWPRVGENGWLGRAPGQMRRRVSLLGLPYLLWSVFYAVLGLFTAYSLWAAKRLPWTFFVGLVGGTDGYHMYFLLVSVEFAVIFPLFLKLLHATRNHHVALLVISGLVELGTMAIFHYVYQPDFWWRPIAGESSLTAYQFWLVAGGVAALHLDAFHNWCRRHKALIVVGLAVIVGGATAWFFADVAAGQPAEFAGRSLQPVTVPLSIAAIAAFYLLSVWIAGLRQPWVRRTLISGTYLSFGIYLTHPAILTGLLYLQKRLPGGMAYHPVLITTLICVVDFALAVVVSWLISQTRWSKELIGRPRKVRAAQPAQPEPAAS